MFQRCRPLAARWGPRARLRSFASTAEIDPAAAEPEQRAEGCLLAVYEDLVRSGQVIRDENQVQTLEVLQVDSKYTN